jgi:hypothetical protein
MKNIPSLILALMTCLFLSSCVTSVNPLVTYGNIINNDAVVGVWTGEDQTVKIEKAIGSEIFLFNEDNSKKKKTPEQELKEMPAGERNVLQNGYIVNFYADGKGYYMALLFTSINGDLFAQLQPLQAFVMKENEKLSSRMGNAKEYPVKLGSEFIETYTFAKVSINNNVMIVKFIDYNFLDKQLKAGTIGIRYEDDNVFQNRLITASTEDLQKFISKYGKDARLYTKESTLVLTRQH